MDVWPCSTHHYPSARMFMFLAGLASEHGVLIWEFLLANYGCLTMFNPSSSFCKDVYVFKVGLTDRIH